MLRRVPLAWCNLTQDPRRFGVSLAGISFAVVLMFVQNGFRNALLDSTAALVERIDADLFVVSTSSYSLSVRQPFSRRRVYQALAVEGVASVEPLYLEDVLSQWRNPDNKKLHSIRALGFDPDADLFDRTRPGTANALDSLHIPDRVLFDERSKPIFGRVTPGSRQQLAGRPVVVAGTFRLGADFGAEGNVLLGSEAFAEHFRHRPDGSAPLAAIDLGIVRLLDPTRTPQTQQALRQTLPPDVTVLTKDELSRREKRFWDDNTPVGFTFGFGMGMGFVVGLVICYQILSTDVADHLREYATLKAMGYTNRYLTGVVIQEAWLLAGLAFGPGLAASWLIFQVLHRLTGLPMVLSPDRVALVLGLTLGMCTLSGWLALRKVRTADPAEVFG